MTILIVFNFVFSLLIHILIHFQSIILQPLILGRFIEQVNAECLIQEYQLCISTFSNYFSLSIAAMIYFNDTLSTNRTGQC